MVTVAAAVATAGVAVVLIDATFVKYRVGRVHLPGVIGVTPPAVQ